MKQSTEVEIKEGTLKLKKENKIVMLGSCFANEIGTKLHNDGYNVCINPFGTIFNPVSVANSLNRLASCTMFNQDDVIECIYGYKENSHSEQNTLPDNLPHRIPIVKYGSFYHYTLFSKDCPQEFLDFANNKLLSDSRFFKEADTIIITLGTSWLFRHIKRGIIVSNCHKIPAKEFSREFLSFNECVGVLKEMLFESNGNFKYPDKKIIFTVSPVRHLKDGIHGNQISKANLLLSIDYILKEYGKPYGEHSGSSGKAVHEIYYFPAYEIMLDELRDYKYYAPDLVHPGKEAVDYIYDKFRKFCL